MNLLPSCPSPSSPTFLLRLQVDGGASSFSHYRSAMARYSTLAYSSLLGSLIIYVLFIRRTSKKYPLPPGPPRYPIIGALLSFPKVRSWIGLAEHKKLYGRISFISIFGQKFVMLNDRQAAFDLLDGRSAIYSDRPILPFGDLYVSLSLFLRSSLLSLSVLILEF